MAATPLIAATVASKLGLAQRGRAPRPAGAPVASTRRAPRRSAVDRLRHGRASASPSTRPRRRANSAGVRSGHDASTAVDRAGQRGVRRRAGRSLSGRSLVQPGQPGADARRVGRRRRRATSRPVRTSADASAGGGGRRPAARRRRRARAASRAARRPCRAGRPARPRAPRSCGRRARRARAGAAVRSAGAAAAAAGGDRLARVVGRRPAHRRRRCRRGAAVAREHLGLEPLGELADQLLADVGQRARARTARPGR